MQRFNTMLKYSIVAKSVLYVFQFEYTLCHINVLKEQTAALQPHHWYHAWCTKTQWCSGSCAFCLRCLIYFSLIPLGLEGGKCCPSMHHIILQTQISSNLLLQFSNAYFVAYGIFQEINVKTAGKKWIVWFLADCARLHPCTLPDALNISEK